MSTTKIDLVNEDDEESSSDAAPNINTAKDRKDAFYNLLPATEQQFRMPFAPLLKRVLEATDHTSVASVIKHRGPSFDDRSVGDPYPLLRLEGYLFARHVDFILVQRPNKIVAETESRMTKLVTASASDVACLLDARKWINDNVIDVFGTMLENHYDDIAFLPSVAWKVNPATLVKYFTPSNADFIKQKKYLLAPVFSASHWTFLVFKTEENSCMFFNSFHDPWTQFANYSQLAFFDKLTKWLETFLPAYKGAVSIVPTLVWEYPAQIDGVSCAVYTMHGMHCIASANQNVQFGLRAWDTMADVLRFDIFMCLMQGRIRPLMSATSFHPVLTDPPSDDFSDEEPYRGYQTCAQCEKVGHCRICLPWEKAFCSEACQEAYAEASNLGYL